LNLHPEASPYGPGITNGNLKHIVMNFFFVHRLLDPPFQETSKVPRNGGILPKTMMANPLVQVNPNRSSIDFFNQKSKGDSHVTQVEVLEHVILRTGDCRMTINGGSIQIRSHGGPTLDMLVTPVIALGGGEDGIPRIAEGTKRRDVRVTDVDITSSCEL
jgi:hypothetical protein